MINYKQLFFGGNVDDLVGIIKPNHKFEFEFVNEQIYLNLLGYSNNDLIGESFLNFLHPDDLEKTIKILKGKTESEDLLQEIRIKHKNNRYIWFEIKIKKFKDDNNQNKLLIILKDISKRKELEEKLRVNEERFRKITQSLPEIRFWKLFNPKKYEEALRNSYEMLQMVMENIPQYIFWKDVNSTYLGCNYNYAKFIGVEHPEDIIGKTTCDFLTNKEKANQLKEREINVMTINKPEFHRVESWILKDGIKIWLDTNRIPLYDSEGNVVGIIVTLEDITERKIAEQKLKESERKYRGILETIQEGYYEVDLKGNFTFFNDYLCEFLGYSKDKLLGVNFREVLDKETIKNVFKIFNQVYINEIPVTNFESKVLRNDRKTRFIEGTIYLKYDSKGKKVGFYGFTRDITEKKLYEELIFELNINFLNFSPDIQNNIKLLLNTCFKLLNGDIILFIHKRLYNEKEQYQIVTSDNKAFTYDSEYFLKNLFISKLFFEKHDKPQTFFNINETKYAKTDHFIIDYKAKGCYGKLIQSQNEFNNAICVFFKHNPSITNRDRLVLFLIGDAIEIEQKRWQVYQDLKAQNIMLNEINKFKTELLSRTSHELKTPLVSIKGFTELLLTLHKSRLDSNIISILEEIKDGSKRLENIINLLIQSSKLDKGQIDLSVSKEDLIYIIKKCVKELQGLSKLRNQSISFKIHDSLKTNFDKERIHEVISNLLVNAIKFTPPGGDIIIQSEVKDDYYVISIKDNGIGLTKAEKNQIFEQFGKIERYGQGWDIDIKGTGLGLYNSKKIVELHGGKIWAESEGRNKGSTFYFSIPRILK